MKRYLIATACDKKFEKFLLEHWYKSLKENVDLSEIDVLIIDWGLSEDVKKKLEGALILKSKYSNEGLINNLRFMDLHDFLEKNPHYEQVILCDGGDIIFQADVSHLFAFKPNKIRGVTENISPNMDILMTDEKMRNSAEIVNFLKGKKLINVGFIVYPCSVLVKLVEEMFKLVKDKKGWGVETILLNYLIYKSGFYELSQKYNFIPTTSKEKFYIKDSKFYLKGGKIIPIVHNAGNKNVFRSIRNFGYGKGCNEKKRIVIFILRNLYRFLSFLRKPRKKR